MSHTNGVSRRSFFGGLAAAVGYIGLRPQALWAQARAATQRRRRPRLSEEEYDAFAKLSSNENPYGPTDVMMDAMNMAWKYWMR